VASLATLAAVLGPAGQGEVAFGYLVATVGAGVASAGLEVALLRSSALDKLRADAFAAVWTQTAIVTAVSLAVLAALLAGGAGTAATAGVAGLPGLLFTRLAASCAFGAGRRRAYVVLTVGPWAVYITALATLAAAGALTPSRALVAFALSNLVTAALAAAVLVSWLGRRLVAPWRSESYATAIRVFPGMIAQLGNFRFDQVLIAALLTRSQLGLYTLAVAATEASTLPAQATANAFLPASARLAQPRRRVLAAAGIASALVLLVVPAYLALVKFGLPRYEPTQTAFLLLIPGTAALAASKVVAAFVTGSGHAWRASRVALVTFVLTAVATPALVPPLGISGAALATSLAYCTSLLLLLRTARPLYPIQT
jgi:O-antigen/teichoic acid export membrane protein